MTTEAIFHHRHSGTERVVSGLFPPESGRLHLRGRHFYTEDDQLWQWRGKSMFLLFLRYCRGEDITPDLRWLRAFGFNIVRIFGPLPWELTPDYRVEHFRFDKLPGFFALLESYGLRCNWSLGHYRHPGLKAHVQRWYDIAADFWSPSCAEGVNEPHVHGGAPSADNPLDRRKPDPMDLLTGIDTHGIPTAYGYYVRRQDGLRPVKDFGTIHPPRDSAWARKARHAQELQPPAWISDEPGKAIEIGTVATHPPTTAVHPGYSYPGGKTKPHEFAWHHGVCALWTPGSTFHDEEGKWGCVPRPGSQQYLCAEAVRDHVWLKIGAEWQEGEYNRSGNSDSPVDNAYTEQNQIWTYTSLHAAEGKALSIRCGPIPLKAINGWRIVDAWAGGTMARLER